MSKEPSSRYPQPTVSENSDDRFRRADSAVSEEGRRKRRTNHEIMIVTYVFLAFFFGMIAFLGFFMYKKSEEYASNPYNARRQAILAERCIRGDILSADGQTLATTEVEDGNETRKYPFGRVFAHIVGYSQRGTAGIEAMENTALLTSHNNPLEVLTNELQERKNQGDTVVTTLLPNVQEAAYDALGDNRGAVVAIEPATGKVVAMVSKPDFNPNKIADEWEEINSADRSSEAVLVNRASQGLYPPGSTFKLITLLEFLREAGADADNFTYDCKGAYTAGDYSIRCAHDAEHGEQNLTEAFSNSCNGAFVSIGRQVDFKALGKLCGDFGFNTPLPTGFYSNPSRFKANAGSDLWTVMLSSIGQGETVVTPLHMAMIFSAVANGGVIMKPYIVNRVVSADGTVVQANTPSQWRTAISGADADLLKGYLRRAVTEGTGAKAQGDGYKVWGKTGTAEFNSKGGTHAWFVGFAGEDTPQIVISVIVENGQSGGDAAAPIFRKVADAYFR